MKKSTAKIMYYTIVEMMMVIAVFMIILSMAMVAWLNSGSQANLKNAARLFSAQLNLAKAKAVANRTLVRLEITEDNDRYKIEMFYGESGTQKPHDVEPIYLPRGIFFAKDKDETVVSSNGWWKKNALKNNAVLKVPRWIKSIRVLSGLMGQKSDEAFNYSNEFELRKNDEKLVLYSRNNNDDRTKNGEDLCKAVSDGQPAWVTIANENYAGSDEGQELSGKSVSAYTRQTSVYGVFTGE